MTFTSPAWLLGLLLVPVIWYLHRSGPILRSHPVENLDLWRGAAIALDGPGARRRPDPAWVRRALIAATLALALASPSLDRPAVRVSLWIDDSLSLSTMESGRTRLARALDEASAALRADGVVDLEVRALSQPWRKLPAKLDAAAVQLSELETDSREFELPAADLFAPTRRHWLVTDGADADVNEWLSTVPITRVFQSGVERRNVGIARVSVRLQPGDPSRQAVLVRLVNGGEVDERRRLELLGPNGVLDAREVPIAPGASAMISFEVPSDVRVVTTRLVPSDALPVDDVVSVDATALAPLAVAVDSSCPAAVRTAVRAHPSLRAASDAAMSLAIDCGTHVATAGRVPRVRFATGAPETVEASALSWSTGGAVAAPPFTGPDLATRGRVDPPGASDLVLLEAAGTPLVVLRPGPPILVETSIHPEAAGNPADATTPLLIAWLIDAALGERLLGRAVHAGHGESASRVLPLAELRARSAAAPVVQPTPDDSISRPLLWLALVLLLWDTTALARRLARERRRTAGVAA
jgi:hypothetical protein